VLTHLPVTKTPLNRDEDLTERVREQVGDRHVLLGLSGGVDSSAAASLLVEQGYDVVGITLKVWPQDCVSRAEDKCCGPQAVMDARSVADKLDIPYYLVDESKEFQRDVIDYFAAEYKAGRTPNPCVMCNEKLKFGNLIDRARKLGAEYVATGHYAQINKRLNQQSNSNKYIYE
jgi:tRNA-specific 2-thiouridylase